MFHWLVINSEKGFNYYINLEHLQLEDTHTAVHNYVKTQRHLSCEESAHPADLNITVATACPSKCGDPAWRAAVNLQNEGLCTDTHGLGAVISTCAS